MSRRQPLAFDHSSSPRPHSLVVQSGRVLPASSWKVYLKLIWAFVALLCTLVLGTIGYHFIGGPKYSWLDAFYMTFITVATIGYGEIIDMSHNPTGRLFTIFIGTLGLGTVWFMFSTLTVLLLETDLNEAWRRRRMEKVIHKLRGHYIVCGFGRVGRNVAQELEATNRHFVAIDENLELLETHKERTPTLLLLHGDASEDDLLLTAGISYAKGVFAVTGDDSRNLMISLTAKQLNPHVRVVARCHELRNEEKMKKAGADAIVSPDFTGGMRIASAMVRPHVISFLDAMRKSEHGLRLEEIRVPESCAPRPISTLHLRSASYVVLAVRTAREWVFNPPKEFLLEPGYTLIAMASPVGRHELEAALIGSD
ncbi:MAG: NAD-binding protein [Rhodocyclaceae bacterium]|nr:NAD-binding protein [Rhodocyclaceae bacterium]